MPRGVGKGIAASTAGQIKKLHDMISHDCSRHHIGTKYSWLNIMGNRTCCQVVAYTGHRHNDEHWTCAVC